MTNSTNAKLVKEFNAEFDGLVKVSHNVPYLAGEAARFYRAPSGDGWMIHEAFGASGSGKTTAKRISATIVNAADAVEFDPYNDAGMAQKYLALASGS
jgi:hypothetical protein